MQRTQKRMGVYSYILVRFAVRGLGFRGLVHTHPKNADTSANTNTAETLLEPVNDIPSDIYREGVEFGLQ